MDQHQPVITADRLRIIRTLARSYARRLRGGLVEAGDLENESVMRALVGRKSSDGPMLDLLRRQGLVGNHRSSRRDNPVQVEMPAQLLARETLPAGLLATVDLEKLIRMCRFTRRERRVLKELRRDIDPFEIATRMRLSQSRISYLMRAVVIKLTAALEGKPLTEVKLQALYVDQALTTRQIAALVGRRCSHSTVRKALQRCGIPLRKAARVSRTVCRETGCTKPTHKIWVQGYLVGTRCRFHFDLINSDYVKRSTARIKLRQTRKVVALA